MLTALSFLYSSITQDPYIISYNLSYYLWQQKFERDQELLLPPKLAKVHDMMLLINLLLVKEHKLVI